jgi:hypothetical protein
MKLRSKNLIFQSCRYCFIGVGLYRIDSDEGTYYICEKHREEQDFIKVLPIEGIEEDFGEKIGLLTRAINYIKGG